MPDLTVKFPHGPTISALTISLSAGLQDTPQDGGDPPAAARRWPGHRNVRFRARVVPDRGQPKLSGGRAGQHYHFVSPAHLPDPRLRQGT